jgi:predicted dehydrogenase
VSKPIYALIGRGPWGNRLSKILKHHGRHMIHLDVSRPQNPNEFHTYHDQIVQHIDLYAKKSDIVWIAIPPGHQYEAVKSVLTLDKHVIIEKPWMVNAEKTRSLIRLADARNLNVAVHYQYCFLDKFSNSREQFAFSSKNIIFSGIFNTSKKDRNSIPSLFNLGCHLLAIKHYYFPNAQLGVIKTAYETDDQRSVTIKIDSTQYLINFLNNREPLIQKFIDAFELDLIKKARSEFDLHFSLKIMYDLYNLYKKSAHRPK